MVHGRKNDKLANVFDFLHDMYFIFRLSAHQECRAWKVLRAQKDLKVLEVKLELWEFLEKRASRVYKAIQAIQEVQVK
jgi:hypothetical protein